MSNDLMHGKERLKTLIERIGHEHVELRLQTEREHEAQLFGQGTLIFNLENLYLAPFVIEFGLKLTGLYGVARRNGERVLIKRNLIRSASLPRSFDGFTMLHVSDLHGDTSLGAMGHLADITRDLVYDICVLTGDYRGKTYGSFEKSLEAIAPVMASLKQPIFAVLGNHDSILMTPALEAMGAKVLFNETEVIARGNDQIYLAGIDDAHFYRVGDIGKAAHAIPVNTYSILLSHTPEVYREAAHRGFDLMLSGHTHGGQLCLPYGVPIKLEAKLPRRLGSGAWRYGHMAGYTSTGAGTSLLPVRLNCPAEVTLHTLRQG
ncbi:metallophosphoesterase [Bradyrhizobium manausense]|nr:metallophosphoesterase [Bradyrhizobium manausense]